MRQISYYTTARGECPFQTFLDGATEKVQAKFGKMLNLLEEKGPELRRPYADYLRDGIWELRVGFGGDQFRALYFFWDLKRIVITHGIIKKTNRVPPGEIDRALRHTHEHMIRHGRG